MTPINGKDALMYVFRDSAWVLTVCAKQVSIEWEVEDINIATVDSGTDNDYVAGFSDATASIDGLVTIDEVSRYQFHEWVRNRRSIHRIKIVLTNSFGDYLQYEFRAKIQRISNVN